MDTGDIVIHKPSGEEWQVAMVDGDRMMACGWPAEYVPLTNCELVTHVGDQLRTRLLKQMAKMYGDDPRKEYAQRRLGLAPNA